MPDGLQKQDDAVIERTQAQLEKELAKGMPRIGGTKQVEGGLIALLIGAVTGIVLACKGFFSDPKKK